MSARCLAVVCALLALAASACGYPDPAAGSYDPPVVSSPVAGLPPRATVSTPPVTGSSDVPADCLHPRPNAATPEPAETGTPVRIVAAPRGTPSPVAFTPIREVEDATLESQVRAALGADTNGYGVFALNLKTGRAALVNADQPFYTASLFKLFVLYEIYRQVADRALHLDERLTMTPYYDSFGLGPRATQLCQTLTVSEAMAAMMSVSDNAAAVLLQDLVGAGNVNADLAALGMRDSHLEVEDLSTTARDLGLLLEAVATGRAVDAGSSAAMVRLMESETFDNGLRAAVPAGVRVAHKTGNWSGATHDAGIVFSPAGNLVVVLLSARENDATTVKALASLIYEYYQSKP